MISKRLNQSEDLQAEKNYLAKLLQPKFIDYSKEAYGRYGHVSENFQQMQPGLHFQKQLYPKLSVQKNEYYGNNERTSPQSSDNPEQQLGKNVGQCSF